MKMPNLFLVAAPRAGSTQLAHWLASHPDITLSQVKEPNFFSAHEFDPAYVAASHLDDINPDLPVKRPTQFAVFRDPARYAALFETMQTPWRMEASTSYLCYPQSPALIRQACPDARIILLTRDPMARALSHYRLARRTGRTRAPLADELAAELAGSLPLAARYLLRPSQQNDGVTRFKTAFGRHILHIHFESMVASPQDTLAQIGVFLGIAHQDFDMTRHARNAGAEPRFSQLNAALLHSGIKTRVRKLLPHWSKPYLRKIWFSTAQNAPVTPQEIKALQAALGVSCES